MKIANKLVSLYPEFGFWKFLNCKYQLNCMSALLSKKFLRALNKKYSLWKELFYLKEKEASVFSEDELPQVENLKFKKPKKLIDFC